AIFMLQNSFNFCGKNKLRPHSPHTAVPWLWYGGGRMKRLLLALLLTIQPVQAQPFMFGMPRTEFYLNEWKRQDQMLQPQIVQPVYYPQPSERERVEQLERLLIIQNECIQDLNRRVKELEKELKAKQ